jgi:hypothetical protein
MVKSKNIVKEAPVSRAPRHGKFWGGKCLPRLLFFPEKNATQRDFPGKYALRESR